MSLINDDIIARILLDKPIIFEDICAVYPATIDDIVSIGYEKFMTHLSLVTMKRPTMDNIKEKISSEELKEDNDGKGIEAYFQLISELSDFEYLLAVASLDAEKNLQIKEAFRFFIHDSISFSTDPPQIVIGDLADKYLINEENFDRFKALILAIHSPSTEEPIIINEDDSEHVKGLKRKMIKNREAVAKAKAKKSGDGGNLAFSDLIASLPIGNNTYNLTNIGQLTYYAFQDQLKRMGWKEGYDINTRAALAGAKINKSDLKHWMRGMVNKDKQ